MSQTRKSQHAVAERDHMLNVIAILSIHFIFPSKLTRNMRLSHRSTPSLASKRSENEYSERARGFDSEYVFVFTQQCRLHD